MNYSPSEEMKDDRPSRKRALDPSESFLIQAPAGSGKTQLLVERFLTLLSRVEEPEEVLALTFTRKAQAEMTHRIWQALSTTEPNLHFAELIERIRDRSRERGWDLERMPQRLRIMTIDGFALALVQKMPWSAARGQVPKVAEVAESLYQEAARRVIEELVTEPNYRRAIGHCLVKLGGDPESLVAALVDMLAVREQWQFLLYTDANGGDPGFARRNEEAGFRLFREIYLRFCREMTFTRVEHWLKLARDVEDFRKCSMTDSAPPAALEESKGTNGLDPEIAKMAHHVNLLRQLFFTSGGKLRRPRGLHKLLGPRKGLHGESLETREPLVQAITHELQSLESDPEKQALFRRLNRLPRTLVQDSAELENVFLVLSRALYQLKTVFRETGTVDFSEITEMAILALGDEEPTDLALALDFRIQHLLVDEFQDTSIAHFTLLRKLLRGWQPGDGHSFFAVGDPLQSIYRFRQAEVAVFLNCKERGFPDFKLKTLVLHDNYRSHPALVDWLNQEFKSLLPPVDDLESGAVRYNPARAARTDSGGEPRVQAHLVAGNASDDRARMVVELIHRERNRDPKARIAVLVDTHDDAKPIARLLRIRNMPFRALDLESLDEFSTVQDLLMLSLALLHPADRRAWLAVLRAPWIGLSLADLVALQGIALVPTEPLNPWPPSGLSADGVARLERAWPVLQRAFERLSRTHRLREVIEAVWLELGGPALYGQDFDLVLAERFLDMLDECPGGEWRQDPLRLFEAVNRLRAPHAQETEDPGLELLTIHRAKGLEWDVVILGGMNHKPPRRENRLLEWLEWIGPGRHEVITATSDRSATQTGQSGWYSYLRAVNQEKDRSERVRLAYVAATRARERLHLVAMAGISEKPKPRKDSLADVFWPFLSAMEPIAAPSPEPRPESSDTSVRLRVGGDFPGLVWPEERVAMPPEESAQIKDLTRPIYDWAGTEARILGVVLHEICAWVGRLGWERGRSWYDPDAGAVDRWLRRLVEGGLTPHEARRLARDLGLILKRVVDDPEARWILGPHPWAACELALQGEHGREQAAIRIDRIFCEPDGTFWMIDYKLGRHAGGDLEAFLQSEEIRYRPQLERYARLFRGAKKDPLRLGLYFLEPARFRRLPSSHDGADPLHSSPIQK